MFLLYNTEKFKQWILSNSDMRLVSDIRQAQWLTIDGLMYGTVDKAKTPTQVQKQIVEYLNLYPEYNAIDITKNNFWSVVHEATGLIRVVLETEIVRTMIGQKLTKIQLEIINNADFEIEPYTKNRHYFD